MKLKLMLTLGIMYLSITAMQDVPGKPEQSPRELSEFSFEQHQTNVIKVVHKLLSGQQEEWDWSGNQLVYRFC